MVGADICGFGGNTTSRLCSRWFQVGAFYPFSRDHNSIDSIPQEPYALGPDLLETSFKALKFRYAMLKYYYTQFVKSGGKGMIVRPLFFQFPYDDMLYLDDNQDSQMLIGKSLLVAPIYKDNTNIRTVYLPKKTSWYNLEGKKYQGGLRYTIQSNLREVAPTFLREGSILFLNNVVNVTRVGQLNSQF